MGLHVRGEVERVAEDLLADAAAEGPAATVGVHVAAEEREVVEGGAALDAAERLGVRVRARVRHEVVEAREHLLAAAALVGARGVGGGAQEAAVQTEVQREVVQRREGGATLFAAEGAQTPLLGVTLPLVTPQGADVAEELEAARTLQQRQTHRPGLRPRLGPAAAPAEVLNVALPPVLDLRADASGRGGAVLAVELRDEVHLEEALGQRSVGVRLHVRACVARQHNLGYMSQTRKSCYRDKKMAK